MTTILNIDKKDNNDNLCYICLGNIDYYIKFNCQCHNYLHINCIDGIQLIKCVICHKKNNYLEVHDNYYNYNYNYNYNQIGNFTQEIFYLLEPDFDFINYIYNKINIQPILNYMLGFFHKNPNIIIFSIYFFASIIFTLVILVPIVILSIFVNLIKKIFSYEF